MNARANSSRIAPNARAVSQAASGEIVQEKMLDTQLLFQPPAF
jgi:hypothetical protein